MAKWTASKLEKLRANVINGEDEEQETTKGNWTPAKLEKLRSGIIDDMSTRDVPTDTRLFSHQDEQSLLDLAELESTTGIGSASSDADNSDTFLKYAEALNKANQARKNPFIALKEGISEGISLLDPNGDKALLTEEQKVNYANNNLSNLSEEDLNKLRQFAEQSDNRDINIINSLSLGATGDTSLAFRMANAKKEQAEIKQEMQERLGIDDETFNKYVASANYLRNLEDRKKQQEELANADAGTMTAANVASILTAPIRSAFSVAGYVNEYANPYRDENFDVDHNAMAFDVVNFDKDTTRQTSKNIDENVDSEAGKFALQTLYQGGKSGIESMLRLGTVGQVGTIAEAGLEAYDNAREEAQERGLTKTQAIETAVAQGMAEAAFEVLPVENLGKLFKQGGEVAAKGVKNVFKEIGKQSAFEGLEEVETNLANLLTDAMINKEKSEFNVKVEDYKAQGMSEDEAFKTTLMDTVTDNVQAFLGGAIGGLLGGGTAVVSNVATQKEAKKLDGNYREVAQAIPDNVEDYNSEEDYNKAMEVKALAEELDTQDKVSSADRSGLLQDIYAVNETMPNVDLIENINESVNSPFADVGGFQVSKNDITSQEVAQSMAQANNVNDFVEAYRDSQASSNVEARQTGQEYFETLAPKFDTFDEGSRPLDLALTQRSAEDLYTAALNGEEVNQEELNTQKKQQLFQRGMLENTVNQRVEAQRQARREEQRTFEPAQLHNIETPQGKADIADITLDNDGNFKWTKGDEEVIVPRKDISDNAMQRFMVNALNQPTLSAKQLYIDNYDGSIPIGSYNNAYESAYNAGQLNSKNFKGWLGSHKFYAKSIPESTLEAFFNEGAKQVENKSKKVTSAKTKGTGKVTVEKGVENTPIHKLAQAFASKTGIDVEIRDGSILVTDGAQNALRDAEGNEIYSNGQFQADISKVIVGANGKELQTFMHEAIGEVLEAYNPEDMADIQDAILNYLLESKGDNYVDKTIKRYQRLYQAAEGTKSYRDAANEMVNDTLVGLFTTDKGANDFVNWCTKNDKSVLEKITDFIQAIIDKLKSLISDANLSSEARTVAEMSEKQAQKIRDRLFKAMDKAIDNYKGAEEGKTNTSTRHSLDANSGYKGWSMSKRAAEAYENGEMPMSKWTKGVIIENIREYYDNNAPFDIDKLAKVPVKTLKERVLRQSSWHHTSKNYNKTNFYEINYNYLDNLTDNDIEKLSKADDAMAKYKIREAELTPQNAKEFIENNQIVRSTSGHGYIEGRKPTSRNYDEGLEKFFRVGENRTRTKVINENGQHYFVPVLQEWNGTEWVDVPDEKGTSADARFSLDVDTEGNELSEGQKEFYKDNSKESFDDKGRFKQYYHGTRRGGFTVFDKERLDDKRSIFLTDNKGVASSYASAYEDLFSPDKPYTFEELQELITDITYGDMELYEKDGKYAIFYEYDEKERTFDTLKEAQAYFMEEYIPVSTAGEDVNVIYPLYAKYSNPYVIDAKGKHWNSLEPIEPYEHEYNNVELEERAGSEIILYSENGKHFSDRSDEYASKEEFEKKYGITAEEKNELANGYVRVGTIFVDKDGNRVKGNLSTRDYTKYAYEKGYDSVVFNNLKDNGGYGSGGLKPSQVLVVFDSNRVKSIYNENPTESEDIRYSLENKSDAEIDKEYMDAVEAEDMATLNRMVREYASMKGFTSPKVYHGTEKFGFTKFRKELLDDRNSIFVTEDRKVAASYSGTEENKALKDSLGEFGRTSKQKILDFAKKHLDNDYRFPTKKEYEKELSIYRNQLEEASQEILDRIDEVEEASDKEILTYLATSLHEMSKASNYDEFEEAVGMNWIEMAQWDINSAEASDIYNDVITHQVVKAENEVSFKLNKTSKDYLTKNGTDFELISDIYSDLKDALGKGIYEFYSKEDNIYEIDAKGANWNRIKTPSEMKKAGYVDVVPQHKGVVRTRDIAEYASNAGYSGVRILNVVDNGGKIEGADRPSNVRVLFNPNDLASADPITYDDNGDVIPLSERFNANSEDIRYSLDVPTTYALDDYDPFIDDDVSETKDSKEAFTNSIIKAANDVLNFNISDKQVSDIADKMISDYSSTVDKEFVTKNLRNIFSAMNSDNIQDMTNALINLSEEVVRQSEEIDPDEQANYDDFIKNMPKIKLSEEQKNEAINRMGDWNTVFGAMGRFLSNDTTTTLDGNVYWQICDNALEHNYVMDRDANDADQLMNIIEAVENMRPQSRAIFEGGDITDAALVTANEIMQQYYGYALKDAQANANLKEVKADLKKQVDNYKKVIGKQYQERVNELNKQLRTKDNEIKQLKAFNTSEISKAISIEKARLATAEKNARADKTNLNKYIERQERNKYLKSIRNQAIRTIKMLENPTRNKFIPEVLQKPTIEMLQTFDFVTYRVRKNGELVPWGEEKGQPTKTNQMWREKMEKLQGVLSNLEGVQDEEDLSKYGNNSSYLYNLSVQLGDVTKGLLDQFLQDTQKDSVKISTLNSEKLKVLDKFMKSYLASINSAQEAMIDGNNVQLAQVGQSVTSEISGLKSLNAVAGTVKKKILDFLNLDMAEPITVFSELGGTMEKLYWHLEKGKDVRDGHIFATEDAFSKAKKELNIDKNEPSKWETGLMSFKDGKLQLTPAQVMSLYAAYGRSQARHHIIFGGVMSSDEGLRGKDKKLKKVQTKPVHLTPKDVEDIVNTLTPQQKALADFMVDYMSNEVSNWGNRVSQKRWGIKLFTESHYFPIKTFDVTRPSRTMDENANASLFSLQNQGFTKPLQKDANNALVLEDIFKVFSDHVAKMAAYDGYVIPINDFMRVFNYAESQETFVVRQGEEGQYRTDASVKEQIQRVFGTKGTQYFTKFIKNVNEDFGEGGSINLIDKLFSNNKAQAVLANGRVVIQQPTAYPRAMEVIDGKYLVKALSTSAVGLKKKIQRSKSHNTLAKFKSKGYYETSIGQSMQQMITGTATTKDKVNEVAGALAGLADDITWSIIYQAAEYKVQAEQKKLEEDSKEYFDAVNKIANEAFIKTQVVDSVFTKSQMMRSRDTGDKMLTAFMAEPTKYYNMLHRGVFNMYQTGNKKAFAKAVYLFVIGQVLNSVAQSAYDAWRDDDDEKDAMEKFLNALLGISDIQEADGVWATMQAILKANLVENLLPTNLLPVVKEVNSALSGWDSKNMSTQAIYDIVADAQKIVNWMQGKGTLTTYGVLNTVAHSLSLATGMPVSSALREVKDLYNNVNNLWDGTNLVKNEKKESKQDKAAKIFEENDSIVDGAKEVYELNLQEQLDKGKSQQDAEKQAKSDAKSAITTTYRDKLVDLKENNMSEAVSLRAELVRAYTSLGDTAKQANSKIEKWFK